MARRLRTALTGLAIMLGVAAVFATSLIGCAVQTRTAELAHQGSRASLQITPRHDEAFDARVLDMLSVWKPARWAAQLPIVEAIRHES